MHLNIARCDYLTLTTFKNGDSFISSIADLYPIQYAKEAKRGGYQGHEWDGLFVGVGKQRRKAHFILRASGEGSDTVMWRTRDLNCRCTRIDLQVTVWMPEKYEARKLYDILKSSDTIWPGRRLVPELRESGDGLDTVYIGSRTSDRFARVYIKPDTRGEPAYLRFEMEFKGAMAQAVRNAIVEKHGTVKHILRSELNRLPYLASRTLRVFERVLGSETYKVKPETVYGQNKTFDWLETQVEPAIFRLLHSHEDSGRMKALLERWVLAGDSDQLSENSL